MAVDLVDYVESLEREVSYPGTDLFPNATEDEWLGNLRDGFWEARLDGFLEDYEEADGSITNTDDETEDITRDLIQLVIFYAGFRVIRNQLRDIATVFRAESGEQKYEKQQSATLLKALLDEMQDKRNILLTRLSDLGIVSTVYVDAVVERSTAIDYGDTIWVDR